MRKKANRTILEILDLPVFNDIYSFSETLGLSTTLIYLFSQKDQITKFYHCFTIPKRNGKARKICAPSYSLKMVQRWILENILYKIPLSGYSYGYIKGQKNPLRTNAERHKDNLYILKLDFKDFFPSIDHKKVFFLFYQLGYNCYIANVLANICTYEDKVPQGAVTSPYLANILCKQLDKRIYKYCCKRDIIYSRYADDLTFSSNNRDALKSIFGMINKIVTSEGFALNIDKIKFLSPKTKKTVTGVTVNDGLIKAPSEMKRKVRAMIHKAIVTGDYSQSVQIKGYIAYISSIEDDFKDRVVKYIESFRKKDYCLFQNSVNAFNDNKFFKSINDFQTLDENSFAGEDFDEIASDAYNEREQYLLKFKTSS